VLIEEKEPRDLNLSNRTTFTFFWISSFILLQMVPYSCAPRLENVAMLLFGATVGSIAWFFTTRDRPF